MAIAYQDGSFKPTRLECGLHGADGALSFESCNFSEFGVKVTIGKATALISREELAAAAVLFPTGNVVTIRNK